MAGRIRRGSGASSDGQSRDTSKPARAKPEADPVATIRPSFTTVDLGRTIERLGATSPAFQELWEVRAEIEKEKLRHVVPFPFFDHAMRFQDEFAALQITDDGRFSYSFVGLNYEVDLEEEMASLEESKVSRVLMYEGVLIPHEAPCEEARDEEAEGIVRIEGRAMAKHEIEDTGGRARLVSISRSSSRFAIVVSPYYEPNMAVVYSLHLAQSPRRPRRTQLPYVGRGMKREHASRDWRLTQQRRRAPKPKFTNSRSTSMLPAATPTRKAKEAEERRGGVASMPQLPALVEKKDKKEMTSIADWRDFYKQRAQELLGT